MATFNHKIQVANGNDTDVFHPETNSGQVYDFTNEKWLSSIIGVLNTLTTSQKGSLVAAINEIAGTKAPLVSPAFTGTPTTTTASSGTNTTQIATTAFVQSNINAHSNDYMPHESSLSQTASSMDNNGIYTVVEYKRADNTLYMRSTATNPDSNGHYQTITWRFYATNGTTLSLTKTWTITYDNNGLAISKVVV